jgi:hypothetical protein
MKQAIAVLGPCATMAWPTTPRGFCGLYVRGADASLYNNATMVVVAGPLRLADIHAE